MSADDHYQTTSKARSVEWDSYGDPIDGDGAEYVDLGFDEVFRSDESDSAQQTDLERSDEHPSGALALLDRPSRSEVKSSRPEGAYDEDEYEVSDVVDMAEQPQPSESDRFQHTIEFKVETLFDEAFAEEVADPRVDPTDNGTQPAVLTGTEGVLTSERWSNSQDLLANDAKSDSSNSNLERFFDQDQPTYEHPFVVEAQELDAAVHRIRVRSRVQQEQQLVELEKAAVSKLTARQMLFAVAIALVTVALLNSQSLKKSASGQKPGVKRDVAVAVTGALGSLSSMLQLDEPRKAVKALIGRSDDDRISGTFKLPVVQPVTTSTDSAPAVTTQAPASGQKFTYTAQRPMRLYMAGDSLMGGPGVALLNRLQEATSVDPPEVTDFKVSSGLINTDFFNWFDYLPQQVLQYRPALTVFAVGGNDDKGFGDVAGAADVGSEGWNVEYGRRVAAIMDLLTARQGKVVWLGLPIPRDQKRQAAFKAINAVAKAEAERRPGMVKYVDLYSLFSGSNGQFAATLKDSKGKSAAMRATDGVHYSPAGAERVADATIKAINEFFEFNPAL